MTPSLIGCLTNSKYSKRQQPDQAAMISDQNHLWLHIRGELIDCGLPRSAPNGAQANPAIFHWVLAGSSRLVPLGITVDDAGIKDYIRIVRRMVKRSSD
jgi:hypothetical protein